MANRFTATEKWIDPWFCNLNKDDKLFWIYLVDNCDHAGIWQVNWPLVQFHIKDYLFNEKAFNGRIVRLKENKWFIPKFIEFQYKTGLNPENRAHLSVINLLKKEGAFKGLSRGFQARKDKDMVKDKDMDKDKYGDFVLLTKKQYHDLCNQFGLLETEERIARLNEYGHQKPKKFKEYGSHYHTILAWARKDKPDPGSNLTKAQKSNLQGLANTIKEIKNDKRGVSEGLSSVDSSVPRLTIQ